MRNNLGLRNVAHVQTLRITRNFFMLQMLMLLKESNQIFSFGSQGSSKKINSTICKKYNLFSYGPFWILTTVIFCLSAVPNILNYQGSQNFQYNFEAVGLAFGFIYVEGFLFPVALTFVLKYFGV